MMNYKIKILFLFAIILMLFSSTTYSQIIRCGVRDLSLEEVLQLRNAFTQWLSRGNSVRVGGVAPIPIAFHVIRYDDGLSADVTDEQINAQINLLNSSFRIAGYSFSLHSIQRINNTAWTTHTMGSPQEWEMKNSLAITPERVLNFYICDVRGGIYGYARFPWEYP